MLDENKMRETKSSIQNDIKNNRIVLFMKGERGMPQCGFSARVVEILNSMGVDYVTRDVLADNHLREGIKEYSNWPTIPQLYVQEKFIGGCDIVMELYETGELKEILG